MTHLYHLLVILIFPILFVVAFLLRLYFIYQEQYGDRMPHYTYLEILTIGWRAYE